jgi:hypothetical protein
VSEARPWRCRKCGEQLGTIEHGELTMRTTEVRSVRCSADGTTWVGCPACPATRAWKQQLTGPEAA